MITLVFVGRRRFEKGRKRAFTVNVWKVVKSRKPEPSPMWGAELAAAWKAVEREER